MAGIKIINLPAVPSAQLTDVFPVSQGGVTYKESNSQLLTLFQSVPGGAGGSNTQVQYNSSGILAGDTGFTTNGAGLLTITGELNVDNIELNGSTITTNSIDSNLTIDPNGVGIVIFPKNISANNFMAGYTTTVSALGTTILTVDSTYLQYFTGAAAQILEMPVVSTLVLGQSWRIVNNSSGPLTVNSSGGNLIVTMQFNTTVEITCILTSGTTAASWNATLISDGGASGVVNDGAINQLAWYAATGNTVSGLTGANSAVLVTTLTGVPGFSSPMTDGELIIGDTAGTPTANTLTAGTGVTITNGAGSITINASGGGLTWSEVTGTSQALAVNNGYISNNAGLVTLTLPATGALGTAISIIGKGAGGWSIAQNAGQNIQVGSVSSTIGAGGSVASTNRFDSIDLICTTANTTWTVRGAPQSAGLTIV